MAEDTVAVEGEVAERERGGEQAGGLGATELQVWMGLCPRLWRASPHAVPPHPHSQRLSPLSGLLTTSPHSVMGRPPFVQVLGFRG